MKIPKEGTIESGFKLPRISATDFADYSYCPRRYYYSRVLGLRRYERHTGQEDKEPSSQERGLKLHELLEIYDFEKKEPTIEIRLPEGQEKDLLKTAKSIAESEVGDLVRATKREGQRREYEFYTRVDGVQCIGRIDLALEESSSEWAIVDYKSGQKSDWSLELYKKQVGFYSALFSHARKISVKRSAIVYAEPPPPSVNWFEPDVSLQGIRDAIKKIEDGDFKPLPDEKCISCDYSGAGGKRRWVCSFGRDFLRKTRSKQSPKKKRAR